MKVSCTRLFILRPEAKLRGMSLVRKVALLAKAFIDVKVFNPQAKTHWEKIIPQMYKSHEEEKKQGYLPGGEGNLYVYNSAESYKKPSSTPAKIKTLDMDLRGITTPC